MFDYFNYFASKGNHPKKEEILNLETQLQFKQFDEKIVQAIIDECVLYAKEIYQKNIGVRITHNEKIYQYLMENVSEVWLLRKEKVCLETKHSSYYIFLDNIDHHFYDDMVNDESYGVCGGSFPLIVSEEVVGAITCTGLRPQEDHQVVIEAIQRILKKEEK